jgi:hypothetical protein
MQSHLQRIKHTTNLQEEDVMRALITLMGSLAPVTAWAASGAREDTSGIFVWVFLGFCALIVVAQVVPALLMMTGMVKGVASVVKEEMAEAKAKN